MRTAHVLTTIAFLVLPAAVFAQDNSLRAAIRADLMKDPRAAEMSEVDLNALIEAVAMQAEEDGTAVTYMESHNSFEPSAAFPNAPVQVGYSTSLWVALLSLAAILLSLGIYLVYNRGKRFDDPLDTTA